jgi:uncharacterized membrane protein
MNTANPYTPTSSPNSDEYYQQAQSQNQNSLYPQFKPEPQYSLQPNYQALLANQGYQQPINHLSIDQQQQPHSIDRKQLLIGQMRNNVKASGKRLMIVYSVFVFIAGFFLNMFLVGGENYKVLDQTYRDWYQRESRPQDLFAGDSCRAFVASTLNLSGFLGVLCWLHIFSICFVVNGKPWCTFIQAFLVIMYVFLAVFASKQQCLATDTWTTTVGQEKLPQNAWPHYAMLAAASLIGCLLGCNWKANEERAEQEKKNLSLILAL